MTPGREPKPVLFRHERPAVLVASHERSGTHFLMNSVAQAYGYCPLPWIDLDFTHFQMNFYQPEMIGHVLMRLAKRPIANMVKSHHAAVFFAPQMGEISRRWRFLYIQRNPVDTILSFWRFTHSIPGHAGPLERNVLRFARSQPGGQMLRYQVQQWPSILHRWAAHVGGWRRLSREHPDAVAVVRYEDLQARPQAVLRSLSPLLGIEPKEIAPVGRDQPQIVGGARPEPSSDLEPPDREALLALCHKLLGPAMEQLGYPAAVRTSR